MINKLNDFSNQVWGYIVTSNLVGQIKQLVNFNDRLGNWVQDPVA